MDSLIFIETAVQVNIFGCNPIKLFIANDVFPFVVASKYFPREIKIKIKIALSKYTTTQKCFRHAVKKATAVPIKINESIFGANFTSFLNPEIQMSKHIKITIAEQYALGLVNKKKKTLLLIIIVSCLDLIKFEVKGKAREINKFLIKFRLLNLIHFYFYIKILTKQFFTFHLIKCR